jgi:hypothetical protein
VNNTNMFQAFIVVMIALSLAGCRGGKKCLSVSEIWHNTGPLDGERICVRGQADFQFIPYHPMQVGGCSLDPDVVKSSHIVGKLDLLDEDSPDPERRLSISESSLHCEGNVCSAVSLLRRQIRGAESGLLKSLSL